MKPEEFAQGERVRGGTQPVNLRVKDIASLEDTVETSPVEKHVVDIQALPHFQTTPSLAKPLSSRMPSFSSSFLQPEQFIAELKLTTGADIRPDLLAGTVVSHDDQQWGTRRLAEADLEAFYEPANSVPTLELFYEGKPAPAPAHLRTVRISGVPSSEPTLQPPSAVATETAPHPVVDKNSEESRAASGPPVLQKSSSRGASGRKDGSPGLHKMGENQIARSCSGGIGREKSGVQEIAGDGGGKQSGRLLRRLLRWGASMKTLGKTSKNGNPNPNMDCFLEPQIEAAAASQDPDEDGNSSPRSSASSVSTTYSEVSSKSQSYKHAHKKSLKSEVVKSKLWLLRVHQKLQGRVPSKDDSEDEGDGIFEALRQGAMFQDTTTTEEAADSLGVLEKKSISKLVAKHKRNSTWDAGKQQLSITSDHIFSPKQPRLPSRDTQVLLAPPKRLTGGQPSRLIVTEKADNSPSSPMQAGNEHAVTVNLKILTSPRTRTGPAKTVSEQNSPTGVESPTPPRSPRNGASAQTLPKTLKSPGPAKSSIQNAVSIRVELPTPPMSPRNGASAQRSSFPGFSPPLPLPVRAVQSSPITSPVLRATSPRVPKSPRRYASPGGGGLGFERGSGFQSSLIAGLDATSPRNQVLNPVEPFSLGENPSSTTHTRARSVAQQRELLRPHSRSDSATGTVRNGVNGPKFDQELPERESNSGGGNNAVPLQPRETRLQLSFEQIVAGRGRSPPTDNTLMKFFFKCREIGSLNKFLALQKRRFLDSSCADSEKCFHMIMSEAGAGGLRNLGCIMLLFSDLPSCLYWITLSVVSSWSSF